MTTLLLVEDNEMNRDMLSRRLARRGYTVTVAVDGLTGVSAAQSTLPDLVLMDIGLPDIDGLVATRRLKADERTRRIPIVVLTAHAMAEERARTIAAGCDGHLTKPIDQLELLTTLQRFLALQTEGGSSFS